MSQALIGFVGVFVGAVVSGLADLLLEKRREGQRVRTARRMLRLELDEAAQFIAGSLEAMRWLAEPTRVLSNEQWAEHRNVWGGNVDDDAWTPVSEAFMAIADVRRNNLGVKPGTRLDPEDERTEDAESAIKPINEALKALKGAD